jgi:hypothetical protein
MASILELIQGGELRYFDAGQMEDPTIHRLSAPSSDLELRPSIESPQGKGASGGQTRVYVVDEVKAAITICTDGRWFLAESKGIERATIAPQHDLNDDQILVTVSIDRKDFGKNWRHFRYFQSSRMIEMTFGCEALDPSSLLLSCSMEIRYCL